VNFELRSVTIARSITERMEFKSTKNDKSRTISMPEALCSILKTYGSAQAEEKLFLGGAYQDEDLLFARADGSPVDPWNFGRAVLDCIKRANVTPITLHGLRGHSRESVCASGRPGRGRQSAPRPCVNRCHSRALSARLPKPRRRGGRCPGPPGRLKSKEKEALHLMHFDAQRLRCRENSCKIRTILVAPAGFEV
jgi:hypothetical protein